MAVRVRGFQAIVTRDYPMPPDKVRFVGEPVAIVVAETIDRAKDAAELLDIAYDPLPAVVRAADAVKPGAPRLWEDAPDNLCIDIEVGDEAAHAADLLGWHTEDLGRSSLSLATPRPLPE